MLNVNDTGDKSIYLNGTTIATSYLTAKKVYQFVFNGTQWDLIGEDRYHTPTVSATASTTLTGSGGTSNTKIATGVGISDLYVPVATASSAGTTVVYPAASCTTFSSDAGTITPLAAQKAAEMFAITRPPKRSPSIPANPGDPGTCTPNGIVRWLNTAGDVQDSKITIEDVTNTKDTSKKAQVISIPAEGGKKMVYGYCTDQVDGTSFIGGLFDASATAFPYNAGLAIGGTSGNLLWKGKKVLDNDDLTAINNKIPTVNNATLTIQKNGTNVATFTANSSKDVTANITIPTGAAADKGVSTTLSSSSTDNDVPTAKAVVTYIDNILGDIESRLAEL